MGARCNAVVRALTRALFFGWIRLWAGRRHIGTVPARRRDYVKALLNHKDGDVIAIYARRHMFEEKRKAATAIEAAGLPLIDRSTITYAAARAPRLRFYC
jgi:hypothetical protein